MNRRRKKLPRFVQDGLKGLDEIAQRLNQISYINKDDEDHQIWSKMEGLIETMTDQPPSGREEEEEITISTPWFSTPHGRLLRAYFPRRKRKESLLYREWSPHEQYPFPAGAIRRFNDLAKENPIPLTIRRSKTKTGAFEIQTGHEPTSPMQSALWFLWQFYFQKKGWERLKRCPQCRRWFVDKTKNKKKDRCSQHCTNQWWSRDRRKKESHGTGRRGSRKRTRAKVKVGRKED